MKYSEYLELAKAQLQAEKFICYAAEKVREETKMNSSFSFKQIITYMMKCNRIGYYASRQNMIKNGATQYDVAKMLAFRLRYISQTLTTPT